MAVNSEAAGIEVIIIMEIITWNLWRDQVMSQEFLAGGREW